MLNALVSLKWSKKCQHNVQKPIDILETFKEQYEVLLEVVLFRPQQTCSVHCKLSMNSKAT